MIETAVLCVCVFFLGTPAFLYSRPHPGFRDKHYPAADENGAILRELAAPPTFLALAICLGFPDSGPMRPCSDFFFSALRFLVPLYPPPFDGACSHIRRLPVLASEKSPRYKCVNSHAGSGNKIARRCWHLAMLIT